MQNSSFRWWWCFIPLLLALNQILIKNMAADMQGIPFGRDWITHMIALPWIYGILACEAISFGLWIHILNIVDVSKAVPLSGFGYLVILATGWIFFKEPINATQIFGSAFILTGIWLISTSRNITGVSHE